jgi:ribosomal protein S18 acetylase RimI-like enzyme
MIKKLFEDFCNFLSIIQFFQVVKRKIYMIKIKPAGKEHAAILAECRFLMFAEMYPEDRLDKRKAEIVEKSTRYYLAIMKNKNHYSAIAYCGKRAIGCGTLLLQEKPPNPRYEKNVTGYILNVYVDVDFRRQGVATKIVEHLHKYLRKLGITRVCLHASRFGYGLYTKIGYKPSESYLEKDI